MLCSFFSEKWRYLHYIHLWISTHCNHLDSFKESLQYFVNVLEIYGYHWGIGCHDRNSSTAKVKFVYLNRIISIYPSKLKQNIMMNSIFFFLLEFTYLVQGGLHHSELPARRTSASLQDCSSLEADRRELNHWTFGNWNFSIERIHEYRFSTLLI